MEMFNHPMSLLNHLFFLHICVHTHVLFQMTVKVFVSGCSTMPLLYEKILKKKKKYFNAIHLLVFYSDFCIVLTIKSVGIRKL